MPGLLLNIDVPDIDRGIAFYTTAFDLTVGRRFDDDFVELLGAPAPIYLIANAAGTKIGPACGDVRGYDRHWTPVHPDIVVKDLDTVIDRAIIAGAVQEGETRSAPYGRIATFADPFGHGFCLIEFSAAGYDALLPDVG